MRQNGGSSFGANVFSTEPLADIGTTGKLYMSVKRMWDFTISTQNDKMCRLWGDYGQGTATDIYISQGFVQAMNVEGMNGSVTTDPDGTFYDPFPMSANVWRQCEYIFQEASPDTMDGFINYCANGSWAFAQSWRCYTWKTGGGGDVSNRRKNWLFGDQMSNPSMPDDSGFYYNDWYVTDTHFRAFISTESSFLTAQQGSTDPGVFREIQLPRSTGNSDTTVNIDLRAGTYTSLTGKYLWVVSASNVAYRVGQWQ